MTFEEYALGCARAFGALIHMRDAPSSEPIPDVIEPTSYYREKLVELGAELAKVRSMTEAECCEAAEADAAAELAMAQGWRDKAKALRAKYEAMLAAVRAWVPPTGEHKEMKSFMESQLTESIKFDCSSEGRELPSGVPLAGEDWRVCKILKLERDVHYHETHHRDEVERCIQRTAWVQALRRSLRETAGEGKT